MLPEIQKIIDSAVKDQAFFPPTDIFNEGFFLKILFQFALDNPDATYNNENVELILNHAPGTGFFCEGHLYSHFRKHRDINLYETDTRADGVIGNFIIRDDTKTRIIVKPNARHFAVIEAKMNAKLSRGIKNAPFYDQAARNIACIAESLYDAGREPCKLDRIGFYVLAPEQKINEGIFDRVLEKSSVDEKVRRRIAQYGPENQEELNEWYSDWFQPTLENIIIKKIAWEEIIDSLTDKFPARRDFYVFYEHCLKHNDLGQ